MVLLGCSVSSDTTTSGPGKSYSSYINDVVPAILAYEKRCGLLDPARADARQRLLQATFPQYLTDARDAAAMAGRVSYDSSCLVGALKAADCSQQGLTTAQATCAGREVDGRVAVTRKCGLLEECKQGYCRGLAAGTFCGQGTCTALGKVGDSCSDNPGACDPTVAACVGGQCVPLASDGGSCTDNRVCKGGSICIKTSVGESQGKCGKINLGMEGAACDPTPELGKSCDKGLACYVDNLMNYACRKTIKDGDACPSSDACQGTSTCVRATANDMTGKCQPLVKPGQECSTDPKIGSGCQLTLKCFSPDGKGQAICTELPENGKRCTDMLPCLLGNCDTSVAEPVCRARSAAGLRCSQGGDCQSGVCDNGTGKCVAPTCS